MAYDFETEIVEVDGRRTITISSYSEDETNNDSNETKIIVPSSFEGIPVTVIDSLTFMDCETVTEVIIPEGINTIGSSAFANCINLAKINLPNSMTVIDVMAFDGCVNLAEINFPENLTTIGNWAFNRCKKLVGITLPKGTVNIGVDVFDDCGGLAEINVSEQNPSFASVDGVLFDKKINTLLKYPQSKKGDYIVPDTVVDIKGGAFNNCKDLTCITFPKNLMSGSFMVGCEKLKCIIVHEDNQVFNSIDGVLFNRKGELLEYPRGRDDTDYTIPDGTVSIEAGAFSNCKYLAEINFPETVWFIDDGAFYNCEGLTALTLPMNLLYIGESAFGNCPRLKIIKIPRKTKMNYKALEGFSGKIVYLD